MGREGAGLWLRAKIGLGSGVGVFAGLVRSLEGECNEVEPTHFNSVIAQQNRNTHVMQYSRNIFDGAIRAAKARRAKKKGGSVLVPEFLVPFRIIPRA